MSNGNVQRTRDLQTPNPTGLWYYSQVAVDCSGGTGSSNVFDLFDASTYVFTADLTEIAGTDPSITFQVQDSPDKASWYSKHSFAALTTVNNTSHRVATEGIHRYARFYWSTSGTVGTATASFFVTARR